MLNKLTFVMAAKQFFGMKPDQKLLEFAQELKALTPKDRADMTPLLEKELNCRIVG